MHHRRRRRRRRRAYKRLRLRGSPEIVRLVSAERRARIVREYSREYDECAWLTSEVCSFASEIVVARPCRSIGTDSGAERAPRGGGGKDTRYASRRVASRTQDTRCDTKIDSPAGSDLATQSWEMSVAIASSPAMRSPLGAKATETTTTTRTVAGTVDVDANATLVNGSVERSTAACHRC